MRFGHVPDRAVGTFIADSEAIDFVVLIRVLVLALYSSLLTVRAHVRVLPFSLARSFSVSLPLFPLCFPLLLLLPELFWRFTAQLQPHVSEHVEHVLIFHGGVLQLPHAWSNGRRRELRLDLRRESQGVVPAMRQPARVPARVAHASV